MGLEAAGGLAGLQAAIRERIAQQRARQQQELELAIAERKMAMAEQEMGMRGREIELRGQERKDQLELQRFQFERQQHADEQTARDREQTHTERLDESTPPGLLPKDSPIAGRLQMIGAVTKQEERPEVEVGPLLPGDTGEQIDEGWLKRPTASQLNIDADNRRQQTQDAATASYRQAMLAKPTGGQPDFEWVTRNGNPVQIGKGTAQPGDVPYRAPTSVSDNALDRQRRARMNAAKGFLERLNTLREKINTKMGPAAGISGTVRRGGAAVGLDPDVAEYERIRAAGGRAVAVAIMGAQNLSDQDANAWAGMLPGATVDRETARRLMEQVATMLDDSGATNATAPAAAQEFEYVPGQGLVPKKP
jgi:hypothetical protein